jgi:hypothetical protein
MSLEATIPLKSGNILSVITTVTGGDTEMRRSFSREPTAEDRAEADSIIDDVAQKMGIQAVGGWEREKNV